MTMSLLAGCGQKEDNNASSGDNTAGDSQYHIGFVVHTTSGDVMAAIEYGAKAAAEDYGVKLTYTGPADSDNTQQISMFESLVAAGCDAIVIIAGDSTVWDEPIAVRAQTGDEGTVALGVCVLGPESHTIRAEQVKAAYKDTDMQFTEVFETDLDTTLNYNNWENILTSNPELKAMVGLSAMETTNMGKIAKANNSDVVMAAYDPGTEALNLLKDGYLDVCAFQNVWLEGYLPVQALARMLQEGYELNPEDNLYDGQVVTSAEVTDELMNRAQSESTMNEWYRSYIKANGLETFGLLAK